MLDTTDVTIATETVEFIPLHRLSLGDNAPGGSINVRKTQASKEDDEKTKASILAEGVIQSLLACQMDELGDTLYVAAGNRRLRLLTELHEEGKIPLDYPVPAIIKKGIGTAEARRLSLAENVARAPLHPVDRFEAFKQHADDGLNEADIAARYAMSKKVVKQSLALGSLSPKVRDLWRAGKIDAEVAQTFTLGASHEIQDAALTKLGGRIHGAYQVKDAILGNQNDVSASLKFVGRKEYEAQGGSVVEDLFDGGKYVSDAALLNTMVEAKLKVECARLVADEGWAWAETDGQIGNERYSWRRLHSEPAFTAEQMKKIEALQARIEEKEDEGDFDAASDLGMEIEEINDAANIAAITPEQKAKSGCIVSLGHTGNIEITVGFMKPSDNDKAETRDKTPAEKAKAEKKKEAGGLSEALANRLTEQLTTAAGRALEPHVALCALLAGVVTQFGSPVRMSSSGMNFDTAAASGRFETVFANVMGMTAKQRSDLLLKVASGALDLRLSIRDREGITPQSIAALVDALPARAMTAELKRVFDAKDYFEGVNKDLCLKAIEEAVNKDEARKLANKPKGEVAKFALTNVPKTGWLPELLRTSHYDGPGAKAKGKTKSAKPKAKR